MRPLLLAVFALTSCGVDVPLDEAAEAATAEQALGPVTPTTPVSSALDASLYGVLPDGQLMCYREAYAYFGGTSFRASRVVGSGWTVKDIFVTDGAIYVIFNDGRLAWYKHNGSSDCTFNWQGGVILGSGWQRFTKVIGVGNGVIYAMEPDGKILWYRHLGYANGGSAWASGSGRAVLRTRGAASRYNLFSAGGGIFYVHERGTPVVFSVQQTDYLNGTWDPLGAVVVDCADDPFYDYFRIGSISNPVMASYSEVFAGPWGTFYGRLPNGTLEWNRFLQFPNRFNNTQCDFSQPSIPVSPPLQASSTTWAGPISLGSGWGTFPRMFGSSF